MAGDMAEGTARELAAQLRAEGLDITEWTDEPNTTYPPHTHPYLEVRVVLEGEMTISSDGIDRTLGPGDRIDLPPGREHAARIGPDGVRYLAGSGR